MKISETKVRIFPDVEISPARIYTRYFLKYLYNQAYQIQTQLAAILGLLIYKSLKCILW
jgi:hypothetical protein